VATHSNYNKLTSSRR